MTIKNIKVLVPAAASVVMLFSCSKSFLDKPALGALNPSLLPSKSVTNAVLVGAYAALDGQGAGNAAINGGAPWEASPSDWIYGSVAGGDSHKGSSLGDQPPIVPIATGKADPNNGFFNTKWKALYEGIARANTVIKTAPTIADATDAEKTQFLAEARFLRGHYYFQLKKFFNMVPWIDETTTDYKTPNDKDIWPNIEADFKFAADNLPATQGSVGKANKWAATIYLAKTYLYEKKYTEAQPLFTQAITSGVTSNGLAYNLTDNFEDNFDASKKNNAESVFAIQMVANDGTNSIANANGGDMLNFPYNSPFRCCGFYQPSIDLANSYRTDANGLPYVDDYNNHAVVSDMGIKSDKPFTPDAGNLDPRIDWTVGRRGVPFHDWGAHPGDNWVRDQASAGPYANKKNIYWQASAGTYSDQSTWAPGSAINYNIIRFADVLLMAAEVEANLGNVNTALAYVNRVRTRASNPSGFLHTYADPNNPMGGFTSTPAAHYVIAKYTSFASKDDALKKIYFERKIELACEGHRYFDLVRWGIAQQALTAYWNYEGKITGDLPSPSYNAAAQGYYPIPQAQIDLSNNNGQNTLKQNPGYN